MSDFEQMRELHNNFNQFARNTQNLMADQRDEWRISLSRHIEKTREDLKDPAQRTASIQDFLNYLFFTSCQLGLPHLLRLSMMGTKCGFPVNAIPRFDGDKPLLFACKAGHLGIVKWLASKEFKEEFGQTFDPRANDGQALVFASYNGHPDIVEWLLDQGVNPNARQDLVFRYAVEFYQSEKESPESKNSWEKVLNMIVERYTGKDLLQALHTTKGMEASILASAEEAILDRVIGPRLDELLAAYTPTFKSSPMMHAAKERWTILQNVNQENIERSKPKM